MDKEQIFDCGIHENEEEVADEDPEEEEAFSSFSGRVVSRSIPAQVKKKHQFGTKSAIFGARTISHHFGTQKAPKSHLF
jgi:hypothetical protein